MEYQEKLEKLRAKIEQEQLERFYRDYPNHPDPQGACQARIKEGKKYVKIDVGSSGKYMIDREGNIFGIKAYGVIHRGHYFGTLETINNYYWGDYEAYIKEGINNE